MTAALVCFGFAIAIFALTWGRAGGYDGMVELFWIGVLTAMVPIWLSVWTSESRTWTGLLIIAAGIGLYSLKLFRSPFALVYFDEQGSIRAVHELTDRMGLFQPNPLIPIIRGYPGLQAATGADALTAGIAPFVAAVVLVGFVHVLTPVLVMILGEEVGGSFKVGGLAALIYMANPSFIYFDGQFAYESLALPLLIAALLCYVRWRRDRVPALLLLAAVFASALVVTHPLTTLGLLGILTAFAGLDLWRRDRLVLTADATLIVYTGLASAIWLLAVSPYTAAYLSPHFGDIITSVTDLVQRILSGQGPTRPLFATAPIPIYERLAAIGAAILWVGLAGLSALRSLRAVSIEQRAMSIIGFAIVLTAPLVLTGSAEGVKRLWAVEFIGLAVGGAIVLSFFSKRNRRLPPIAEVVLATILVVGGAAAGSGRAIRFPGPFQIEEDPVTLTTDTMDAASWLDKTAVSGARLFADRTGSMATGAQYDLIPHTHTFDGSRPWRVFFSNTVNSNVLTQLAEYQIQYLFVDMRMAESVPRIGYYFAQPERSDPALSWTAPPSASALTKFVDDPRFARIYDNGSIVIYEVDSTLTRRDSP